MAVQPAVAVSVLLCGFIQYTMCVCNVTCTTDYYSSLNCSCPVQPLRSSYLLEAICWEGTDTAAGSCEILPPQHWCKTELEGMDIMNFDEIKCIATVKGNNGYNDSVEFLLYENIKPAPPFNLQLDSRDGNYNISWETVYGTEENFYLNTKLMFKVRIRTKGKEPRNCFIHEDRRFLLIPHNTLQNGTEYVVDVQANLQPRVLQGFWSEWSPALSWKTKGEESEVYLILILSVLPCFILIFCGRNSTKLSAEDDAESCLKFLNNYCYIPSPEEFFKPLYYTHQGDFKSWVGPTFTLSDCDMLEKSTMVQVMKEKQPLALEKLCQRSGDQSNGRHDRWEDGDPGNSSHTSLYSHDSCQHTLSLGDGLSRNVSILTVTVSEGEGSLGERKEEDFSDYLEEQEAVVEGTGFRSEQSQHEHAIRPVEPFGLPDMNRQFSAGDHELEGISLNSFSSNERSDDGYPNLELDLDTFDSGFLESACNSPVDSDLNSKKQMDAVLLAMGENPQSNYIRQWVIYVPPSKAQGDSTS